MHASSLENMWKCYERYIEGDFMATRNSIAVLDLGGADINGSYRDVFAHPKFHYIAADLQPNDGVALVLNDPYAFPLADQSIDIVVSGQVFEHVEFFWLLFQEMVRVLKEDGLMLLIVPSAGPIHRYPVDCYRFYPDAFRALAKYANCHLETVWMDERGPWNDLVGVFRKHFPTKSAVTAIATSHRAPTEHGPIDRPLLAAGRTPAPVDVPLGAPAAEMTQGEVPYLKVLERLHQVLNPPLYLEIGIRRGGSLRLAKRQAIGIDPDFDLTETLSEHVQLFRETSDTFFDTHASTVLTSGIDFAFIDGMHWFEYALRDFMHIERYANPSAVVVIDDIFPNHPLQANRKRQTRAWTGDVWKLYACLQQYRSDLTLIALNTAPTGLLLVTGLDPHNRVLWNHYNPIVRHFRSADCAEPPTSVLQRQAAQSPNDPAFWNTLQHLRSPQRPAAAIAPPLEKSEPPHTSQPNVSLVVISYNMARELPRTIRSLSPLMQRKVTADDYEIIVMDNGSTVPIKVDANQNWQAPVRYFEMSNPTVSPVRAINQGLKLARSELCGVMIDGARIASPGLIAAAMQASRLHARPVIATLGFHLGSEVQMASVLKGYNQETEDHLLEQQDWTADGYRLFNISVFAGSSAGGWFAPISESNALFMPKQLWQELGGYDERFVAPGGGLANLDLYARACALPNSQLIVLLGEGTFHQVHGGVATNALQSRWEEFHDEYQKIRGCPFQAPQVTPLYLGQLVPQVLPSIAQSVQTAIDRDRSS
jgi:predicted O-methyltransferase YrrM